MRTLTEARDQFGYHPATEVTAPKHDAIRAAYLRFLGEVWDLIPDGPEKTLAIRDLQTSQMKANLAVALLAPVVEPGTVLKVRDIPAPPLHAPKCPPGKEHERGWSCVCGGGPWINGTPDRLGVCIATGLSR